MEVINQCQETKANTKSWEKSRPRISNTFGRTIAAFMAVITSWSYTYSWAQGCSGFREEGKKSELVRTPEIKFLLHMTQSVRQKGSPAELRAL